MKITHREGSVVLGRSLFLVVLAVGGCAVASPPEGELLSLERGLQHLEDGELEAAVAEMERFVSATQRTADEYALSRFHAEFAMARAHAAASLNAPFLTETTRAPGEVGGVGHRAASEAERTRPSPSAHLVAAVYHATRAREAFGKARLAAPAGNGEALLLDELQESDLGTADAHLQVLLTVAYARLGFRERVEDILVRSPELLELDTCLETLDRYGIPRELRGWICELVFHHLRGRNEETAYRFGVMAVEGAQRFRHALPAEAIARIDDWIVNESSMLFVCPQSQTPYIPGERRSPISGVPHIEYVPVERPEEKRK